ncbi:hypothetical protein LIER_36071 [Lithospermum erythrorhizon]|uniref:NAB domain-containing protein n=1 Tax=Lithospermum erythrorhizon TaxID=34254 RepID=A0AAV3P4B2_LITER
MENGDTKNPPEQFSESHHSPLDERWLRDNIEEVNRSYNQIQELIGSGTELFADKSDACYERQGQLIAHVQKILYKHQVLAEQYEHLRSCSNDSSAFDQQIVGDNVIEVPNEYCFQTPDSKSIAHHVNVESTPTVSPQVSSGGSSNTSEKEGSEYSAIFSDSDSEICKPSAYKSARSHLDVHRMLEHHFVDKNDVGGTDDGQLKYEDELGLSRKKLQLSETEVCSLQKNSDDSIELKNQLELAQQQVAMLDAKLDEEKRKASEMQDKIQQYISDISNRDDWIRKLKVTLQEVSDKSLEDELQFHSHISSLSEHIILIEACSNKWENRCESLEKQLQLYEADMAEMGRLHEVQKIGWKNYTDLIKIELNGQVGYVENLNMDLDILKLKYDGLEAEKFIVNGKVQELEAQLCSKENHIWQLENLLQQLRLEKVEIISASDSARKQCEDLKQHLKGLEKEVQSQKVFVCDRAEEKREAIRQLCFTMEYYRKRYEELLQSCKRLRQHLIIDS